MLALTASALLLPLTASALLLPLTAPGLLLPLTAPGLLLPLTAPGLVWSTRPVRSPHPTASNAVQRTVRKAPITLPSPKHRVCRARSHECAGDPCLRACHRRWR